MEYNYEPLYFTENKFTIAKEKLQNEIFNKSFEYDLSLKKLRKLTEFWEWLSEPLKELEKIFTAERNNLIENKTFFFGCILEIYKLNYDARLKSYFDNYYDCKEKDFIKRELDLIYLHSDDVTIVRQDLGEMFYISYVNDIKLLRQIQFSNDAIIEFLNDKLNITATPGEPENIYLGQPINEPANKLFDFLIEYYRPNEKTSVKYVNILQYLKYDANKDFYIFNIKQKDFKQMIKSKVGIEILKFQISEQYKEVEKPILNSLETTFRNEKMLK